jgi:hypothetical protein
LGLAVVCVGGFFGPFFVVVVLAKLALGSVQLCLEVVGCTPCGCVLLSLPLSVACFGVGCALVQAAEAEVATTRTAVAVVGTGATVAVAGIGDTAVVVVATAAAATAVVGVLPSGSQSVHRPVVQPSA